MERRFDVADVGDATSPPSFDGVATVSRVAVLPSQSLDAVYFDTPAHDLAAKLITLRRRSGGADAGWHLKLPAGPSVHTEVRAPLEDNGENQVPDGLLDVVLAVVRDRPLAPVARISTTRDVQLLYDADGAVLAEFRDDDVIARAVETATAGTEQRWREWEVELVGTDSGLLDELGDRLIDSGAAPARYGSKLARALGVRPHPARAVDPVHRAINEQADELLVWDRAVRADADDAVHQMRVTTRKIRSLLEVSLHVAEDTVESGEHARILDDLRWLAALLGIARDAEVLAQRYQAELDGLPPEMVRGRVRERLVDEAIRRYQDGRQQSLIAMRSERYFRLLDRLDALAAELPRIGRATDSAGAVTIEAAYRRVRKAAKAASTAPAAGRDEALHRIRKGAKRVRYAAAATGAPLVAARAKVIQTLLGDHQDSVVSRRHLIRQADAADAAGEDTFSYGLLYRQEEDLAHRCRTQLDQALAELADAVAEGGRVGL